MRPTLLLLLISLIEWSQVRSRVIYNMNPDPLRNTVNIDCGKECDPDWIKVLKIPTERKPEPEKTEKPEKRMPCVVQASILDRLQIGGKANVTCGNLAVYLTTSYRVDNSDGSAAQGLKVDESGTKQKVMEVVPSVGNSSVKTLLIKTGDENGSACHTKLVIHLPENKYRFEIWLISIVLISLCDLIVAFLSSSNFVNPIVWRIKRKRSIYLTNQATVRVKV
ncbi:uncharacterized protein LOC106661028 [Cimex lectularius]|uniref:Uncharacterized protein n=1 Tax=Cimex lectularius TaxID=79782 RepID=A0A8I6R685_CIMLE|nr:uncharacterized protein LOC106661028 [Cimex lectularius]